MRAGRTVPGCARTPGESTRRPVDTPARRRRQHPPGPARMALRRRPAWLPSRRAGVAQSSWRQNPVVADLTRRIVRLERGKQVRREPQEVEAGIGEIARVELEQDGREASLF